MWVCTSLQPWALTGEVNFSLHFALVKPHLESGMPAQERHGPVRVGSEEGHENSIRIPVLGKKAERAGAVPPVEEAMRSFRL